MNSIITLPKLVELLRAASADIDPKLCDDFVPAFTALVAETLKHDDFVKIKGLGTFRKEVTPEKTKVVFVPDREIADTINAPFVFFAPEELSDGVELSDLETPAPAPEAPEAAPSEPEMAVKPKLVEVAAEEPEVEAEVASEPAVRKPEEPKVEASEPEISEADEPASEPEVSEPKAAPAPAPEPEATPTPAPEPKATPAFEARKADINVASDEPEVEYRATPPRQDMVPVRPQADKHNAYAEAAANIRVEAYDDEPTERRESTPWFLIALFYVVGMLVGFGLGFFGHDYISGYTSTISTGPDEEDLDLLYADEPSDSTIEEAPDTIVPAAAPQVAAPAPAKEETTPAPEAPKPEVPKQEAPAPAAQEVYVTVKPGSGLFDIAKKQYGHKEYWVYIYMENTDKIKNPNNVSAGLKLRIPPKEKYDVSKTDDAANLKAAKTKGAEVLKRF